ncbi:S9 family peptidase [Myroides pelagicus]|uniref:Prolyl oligopeptidase family serine peptidase n=1 Tax=Myroides pelagicus TaxID=270914 RepID=A0A7K1GHM3_9FLAO|nr:DPP IV N-terminal domain-containing protein [Myroides pelagicus]MTH28481.1 prolyl oligopeptidase family serine peptidase [Myroides pelagicus]
MINKSALFVLLLSSNILFAQRDLTMVEATSGQYTSFAPKALSQPKWKSENAFSFVSVNRDSLLIKSKDTKWKNTSALTAKELTSKLNKAFKNIVFDLKRIPYDLTWKDEHTIEFSTYDKQDNFKYKITFDLKEDKVINHFKYNTLASEEITSRNDNYLAWLKDNNIVITSNKGEDIVVTNDKNIAVINGSGSTHRNEFGIDQGMWWSPKQDQLLYYRKDESTVSDYPLVQWNQRVAENKNIKYPMAGMANERVSLVIYDVLTKEKVKLDTGIEDQFLTMVTWDPSGNYVYVGVLNRQQNHLKLNQYNAATGAFEKTLFEEKATTYVEPSQGLVFTPNKNSFLHFSEKEGYRQMYLYNTDGKLEQKLGFENVIVERFLGFDKEGKNAFYMGVTNTGLDRQLFKVNLKKGKTEQITTESGTHNLVLNKEKTLFVDQFSNLDTPNKVSVESTENNKTVELFEAKNPYQGVIDMPKLELVTLTAADNKTKLNGRILYPTNFDATKKYPVMIYVYGGPHAQLIKNNWLGGANLFFHYMAQNGYIVFTVDSRGSFNRGRDFEQVIHRQLGQAEMADQLKGVDYLKSLNFVDQDKIGVYGWSFGGFMTTTLSIHHPETFKVGVAGGPVMDWKLYEIMYGERYMDMPEENEEGYAKTSLLNKADKLDNKLLIIHGAQDPVVVQQHSMDFIEACIRANKQVDYFLYPSHQHNVRGKDRVHLNTKIANYFFDYLAKPIK